MLSVWNPYLVDKKNSRTLLENWFSEPFEGLISKSAGWGLEHKKNEDGSLAVSVDVPGIEEKDITVEVNEERVLSVRGERKTQTSSYTVNKSFYVPDEYHVQDIKAELKNGVLTITLPSKPQVSKESIKVPITTIK